MSMSTERRAVQLLEDLGLTEYEARCFVALSQVGQATAKEISDVSGVPRSRVYDAVDHVHEQGLVDVQQSDPREYRAIPYDAALETLRRQYESTVNEAREALEQLPRSDTQEETGAWAIADHDHVTDRMTTLVDDAEREVYLLVVDEGLIEGRVVDRLAAADDRGVSVVVEVPSADAVDRFEAGLPAATVRRTALARTNSEIEGKWLGRILLTDRASVLISSATDSVRPDRAEETAIWATGADHGLVVGLRHLLGARIDDPDAPSRLD